MNKLLISTFSALLLGIGTANAGDSPNDSTAKPIGQDVQPDKNALENIPHVEGHPLTSVVVTQCSLVVAVYLTMPDGRLIRYDHTANIPADQLVAMAYTATRSERIEVSCNDTGAVGFERHDPL